MTKVSSTSLAKFIISSLLGIICFFTPIINGNTPLVEMLALVGKIFGSSRDVAVVVLVVLVALSALLSFSGKIDFIQQFHKEDSVSSKILFILGAVFGCMILLNVGPAVLLDPNVGKLSVSLASSVFTTVLLAGFLITLLAEFGLMEFVGTLIEPIMRPVYRLPGHAAVDGIASFVCAAAVGIFLTNKLYLGKLYTKREACSIATNFSVCSLGFFLVLVDWGKIPHLYGEVILTSFIVVFILAAIMVRIPPLSRIPQEYVDGTSPSEKSDDVHYTKNVLQRALEKACKKAEETPNGIIWNSFIASAIFAARIAGYILSIATISLFLAEKTPIFTYIGIPMIPILELLGIPDAAAIAPSILVSITEIAMPVLLIAGKGLSDAAVFFVVVLCTTQIIFFTESANAIIESSIPISIGKLVLIFLIRTFLAMPLVAIATHILF